MTSKAAPSPSRIPTAPSDDGDDDDGGPAVAPPPARRRRRDAGLPAATLSEFDGVRYLHLGDTPWVQGAMRLRRPRAIELEYVRRMMAWLLARDPATLDDARVVQLGLGAASLTRFCHGELGLDTTAVEINPQVIAACRQWFRLPADGERLRVVAADAGAWVADAAHHGTADALCVDLYDHEAAAPVLDDDVFYRHCHAVLADGGVMTVNLFGRRASFERSARRIAAAFEPEGGEVRMLAPTDEGNTIVLAVRRGRLPDEATLRARAQAVRERCGLRAERWLGLLGPLPPVRRRAATLAVPETQP
ncbi:MAG: hypothetical protein RL456_362 [Pseudomonadota bacterium]|jgi:spermidine synthase